MKINVAEADNALKNKPLYSTAYERIKYLAEARHLSTTYRSRSSFHAR